MLTMGEEQVELEVLNPDIGESSEQTTGEGTVII